MKRKSILVFGLTVLTVFAFLCQPCIAAKNSHANKGDKAKQTQKAGSKQTVKSGGTLHDLLAKLKLTAAQKAKIKAIESEELTKSKAIRADSSLTSEQKRTKLQELHKASRDKIMKVLTAEQQNKLKAMMKNAHKDGKDSKANKSAKDGRSGKVKDK